MNTSPTTGRGMDGASMSDTAMSPDNPVPLMSPSCPSFDLQLHSQDLAVPHSKLMGKVTFVQLTRTIHKIRTELVNNSKQFISSVDGCVKERVPLRPTGFKVVEDWKLTQQKKRLTTIIAVLVLLHLSLMFIQYLGILCCGDRNEHSFLAESTGDAERDYYISYHIVTSVMFLLALSQMALMVRYYTLEMQSVAMYDPLWRSAKLIHSPLLKPLLIELFILSLHEPPGLVSVWHLAPKLNLLALGRLYVLVRYLRDRSFLSSQSGRVISILARCATGPTLQAKAYTYKHPRITVIVLFTVGWLVLSLCMFIAEYDRLLSLKDAVWLVFITMTTVGYGDISPSTDTGRAISCISALFGLVSTALVISIVNQAMTLTKRQKKVVLFMYQATKHKQLECLAGCILVQAWRLRGLRNSGGSLDRQKRESINEKLKTLCIRFRAVRREFNQMVSDFHQITPDNVALGNKLRDMEVMIAKMYKHIFPDSPSRSDRNEVDDDIAPFKMMRSGFRWKSKVRSVSKGHRDSKPDTSSNISDKDNSDLILDAIGNLQREMAAMKAGQDHLVLLCTNLSREQQRIERELKGSINALHRALHPPMPNTPRESM